MLYAAFGPFLLISLPRRNTSGISGAARLPMIIQCSQAEHRCVCVCAYLGASEGHVSAQRSKLILPKVQQQAQTSPRSKVPNEASGAYAVTNHPVWNFITSFAVISCLICQVWYGSPQSSPYSHSSLQKIQLKLISVIILSCLKYLVFPTLTLVCPFTYLIPAQTSECLFCETLF